MKEKNDTMAKRILENGEIKDKKKINKSRIAGMTLIALVVTIIVIIILATVGITIGLGSGGVIEKAEVSKDIVKLSEYGTTIKMITANEYTNKMSNEKTGELKELVKGTLKKDEKWVKDVEDVKGDENKIKVITVEDYIIVAQIWDDGDLDIINAGKDNEEPYPVISIGQEVVDENTIKLKVIADVTTTDKTKGIDTVTFVNTGDAIKNYNKGDVLTFNVTKSGKYTFEAVTNMGKTTRQSVVVKIKSSEADIQIASEPTTSRNTLKTGKLNGVDAGPIEVSIDYGYTKLLKQYKLGEDGTWTNVDSQNVKIKVTDNMTVYARYFDGESKEVKLTSYDVANVDNIAPNAFGITATSTSNSITVNASTIDTANKGAKVGISGVKEYLYRIFRNESWGEWQSSKQFTDLPEGEYKVQAKAIDKAGNETISSNVVTLECKLQRAEVTFDNNDGSEKKQTVSKVVGTELGELPTVSREGYDFAGWYTDKTSGTRVTENTVVPETDVTYYARWEEVVITLNPMSFTYDGTEKKPETTVKVGSKILEKDKDYTVEYKNNINVGTATVTITGKGSYNGVTATTTFKINEKRITIPAGKTLTYNGEEQTGVDSKAEYKLNGTIKATNAKTYSATATLTDTANTKWSDGTTEAKTISWKINAKNLSGNITVSDVEDKTYTGSAITPEVEVKDTARNTVLTKNTDYTISYKNNVNAGTATITITGKGNYTGTVEKTFKINGDENPIKVTNKTVYTGSTVDLSTLVSDAQGDVTFSIKTNGTTTASTLSGSKLTAGAMSATDDKDQTVVITAKAAGNGNYNPGNKEITITVQKYTATLTWNSTTPNSIIYGTTGKTATATVKVTEGTAGKVTYTSGTTDVLEIDANTGALTTKKVGSSEITAKMARTSTVKEASIKKTITVTAKKIEIPTGKTLTYNGEEQTGVDSKAEYRLSGTVKATNIGTYTATATLADANNTQWSDGSTTAKTISWKINAKNLSGNITISNIADQTYTRSAITPQPTVTDTARNKALTNNSDYTLSYKDNTTVGTATITITGKGNYTGTVEKTFKIVKASVVVPTQNGTLTYNRSSQSPKWNNYNTNLMTIGGTTSGINAGNYNATFTLKDKTNYQWNGGTTDDKTVEWRIGQRENTISVAGKTLTYNGREQVLVTVSSAQGTVYYSIGTALTSSNYKTAGSTEMPKATNANTEGYKVYYYCEGDINNKAKSGNVITKINKASNPMGVTNKTVYAGSVTDLTTAVVGAQGDVTFKLVSSGTTTASTLSGSNLTAGTLSTTDDNTQTVVVEVTAAGNDNYNEGSKNLTITVQKYTAGLSWTTTTPSNIIYGTTGKSATVNVIVAGGTKGKITYTSGSTDVLEIDASTGALTTKKVGSSEITASIERTSTVKPATTKKKIAVVQNTNPITATAKTLTYNGKDQELISVSNAQGDVYYSVGTVLSSNNYKTAGSTTIPTRKDANVNGYVVYYYCEGNTNYSAKAGSVTTKINKASLTITADNKTMTYGGTAPTYTYTGAGYVNGETASVLGGTASYTVKNSSGTAVTVNSTTAAGTYTITPSGLSSSNYNITYKTGTLTIGKANGYVTLDANKSVTYGTASTTFAVKTNHGGTLSVSDDNATATTSISGTTVTISNIGTLNAGTTVKVTVKCEATTNYKEATATFTLTIGKATNPIKVTANTLTYNGKAQNLVTTASAQGTVYYSVGTTLTSSNYTTAGSTTIPTQTSANTNGYVIYYYCVGNTNYSAKSGSVTTKINKASLTITADNKTMTYGGTAPTYTYTGAGYVNGETASVLGGTASYTVKNSSGTAVTVNSTTAAGTYTITLSGLSSNNYNITYKTGTLTIGKATNPIKVTANTLTYNGKAQNLVTTASAQGTVYYSVGTTLTSSNYTTAGSTTIPTQTSANTNGYVIYYYCVGNTNYSAKSGSVTTKINKASLTITADNKTMTYGGTAPTYTYTGAGYVNGETASVLGGTASYTVKNSSGTAVTVNSTTAAGTYTITPSGLSSSNYNITYKAGTLTIGKATNPITVTANTLTYNGKAQNLVTTKNAQGAVYYSVGTELTSSNYKTAGSTTIPTQTAANISGYVVYYYCEGNGNYNAKNGNVTVKINKKNPTMTVSNASMIVQDGSSSTFTYTYDGDGAVTVKSSDTSIATCSVNTSTKTVTVNALKTSTKAVTITVSAGEGINYNDTSKTVQIGAIVVTGIPTSWTKNDVTVTATTTLSGHTIQTCKDGKTYTATNSQTFTANGTFYVKVLNGSGSAVGSKESIINKIDKSNPTFTSAEVKNVSASGYDVYIYGVSDVGSGIKQVLFPTWTVKDGQDDIIWGSGTNEGNGTWHYRVNISDHNNEVGQYITHIYI